MNFKNYIISSKYILSIILFFSMALTILNYFNLISSNPIKILEIIIIFISFFTGGFKLGNKSLKKGYLEGIKLGIIYTIIIFILSIFFSLKITLYNLLLYSIIILSSMLGSIFGINKIKD